MFQKIVSGVAIVSLLSSSVVYASTIEQDIEEVRIRVNSLQSIDPSLPQNVPEQK